MINYINVALKQATELAEDYEKLKIQVSELFIKNQRQAEYIQRLTETVKEYESENFTEQETELVNAFRAAKKQGAILFFSVRFEK